MGFLFLILLVMDKISLDVDMPMAEMDDKLVFFYV